MITPQEIRERTFEKAVFGGYDMATVDAFMEEIASDLTLLQKENAVLKGKMKVLADKVDEYRGNEDALRMAMLTAQRVGASMEKDAKEKYDAVIRDANEEARRIVEEATYRSRSEKEKLDEAKAISAKFIDNMEMLCHRHLDFLRRMNDLDFVKQLRADAAELGGGKPAPAQEPEAEEAPSADTSEQSAEQEVAETVKNIIADSVARSVAESAAREAREATAEKSAPEAEKMAPSQEKPVRNYRIIASTPEEVAAAGEQA